jgi:hypothetical protein
VQTEIWLRLLQSSDEVLFFGLFIGSAVAHVKTEEPPLGSSYKNIDCVFLLFYDSLFSGDSGYVAGKVDYLRIEVQKLYRIEQVYVDLFCGTVSASSGDITKRNTTAVPGHHNCRH